MDVVSTYAQGLRLAWYTDDAGLSGDLSYHADILGTSRLLTDDTGAEDHRLRFSAFGEPLPLPTLGEPPSGPPTASSRYGYVGGWGYQHDGLADTESDIGALHVGWRYYDPVIGRFRERDPIELMGGLNLYEYVSAQPTSQVDPVGLAEFTLTGQSVVAVIRSGLIRLVGYQGAVGRAAVKSLGEGFYNVTISGQWGGSLRILIDPDTLYAVEIAGKVCMIF